MSDNNQDFSSKDNAGGFEKLGPEIVANFHSQFAQNHNHHQALFVQALAVLVTVLVGFGYLYIRAELPASTAPQVAVGAKASAPPSVRTGGNAAQLKTNGPAVGADPSASPQGPVSEVKVTVETLYGFLALASLLLSFGVALISNMALGFRRDQAVAAKIRVLSGVMLPPEGAEPLPHEVVLREYFPRSFNPVSKTGFFVWMPEFHQIFLLTLLLVKVVVIASVWGHPEFGKVWQTSPVSWFIRGAIGAVFVTVAIDVFSVCWYWSKWKETAKAAPAWLRSAVGSPRAASRQDE